ncbi:MAG: sporulation protein YhbH [Gammaproteobacteria bacterium]|nr:sporulation protein YhbH [Gammaproteobacteria bacterium]
MQKAIFRPYVEADTQRSDRSARDRSRHRQKVRESIRQNIADIIAEESIIGQSRDKIVKIPIRGVREFRFVFGSNQPGVGSAADEVQPGQVIGNAEQEGHSHGPAGQQPGMDYYETDVTLEELIDIMFEDLELPNLERKSLREIEVESTRKRKGYRKVGVRTHLDKRRTAMSRLRRSIASSGGMPDPNAETRFPFHRDDLKYRRLVRDIRPQSNAVVLCIMDTSGSMDTMKKYLARSFFFLLYRFVKTRYNHVEVVFIAHDAQAREVGEEEFFSKGESGGTMISAGYNKALEVIQERYHPSHWNIYAFHCSDGDNWMEDNQSAVKVAQELCTVCNLFGYGEIKPLNSGSYGNSLLEVFEQIKAPNFHSVVIESKDDIWSSFKEFLTHERAAESAAAT